MDNLLWGLKETLFYSLAVPVSYINLLKPESFVSHVIAMLSHYVCFVCFLCCMGYCFLDICMFHLGPSPDLDRFQVSQKPLQVQTHGFQGWPDGGFMKPKQPIRYQPSADVNRDVSRFFRKGKTVNPHGHQSNVFPALKYDILHSIWAALSENCALCIFF